MNLRDKHALVLREIIKEGAFVARDDVGQSWLPELPLSPDASAKDVKVVSIFGSPFCPSGPRRNLAEHKHATLPNCKVVGLFGKQREPLKMGDNDVSQIGISRNLKLCVPAHSIRRAGVNSAAVPVALHQKKDVQIVRSKSIRNHGAANMSTVVPLHFQAKVSFAVGESRQPRTENVSINRLWKWVGELLTLTVSHGLFLARTAWGEGQRRVTSMLLPRFILV